METSNGGFDPAAGRDEDAARAAADGAHNADTVPLPGSDQTGRTEPRQNPPAANAPAGGAPWNPYAASQPPQQAQAGPPSGSEGQAGYGYYGDPGDSRQHYSPQQPYAQQPGQHSGQQPYAQQQGQQHNPNPYAQQQAQNPYAQQHTPNPYAQHPGQHPFAAPSRSAFGGSQQGADGQPPYGGGFPPNGGQYGWSGAQPSPAHRRRRAIALIAGAFATAAIFGVATSFGIAAATGEFGSGAANTSSHSNASGLPFGGSSGSGSSGEGEGGYSGGSGSGQGSATSGTLPSASAAQETGVVDIVSQLTYDNAESAGTGLVLTSNGEILTNNHVIEDATSIAVTVVSTGKTYTAKVVGTDETDDIAVLKLADASGLSKANLDTSSSVTVGEAVTGVGNAGGTGGAPSAASGTVVATGQTITTQAEESAKSETLHGLIETNADIQAGDSGGPLYNSSNQAVGIDTAASEGTSQTQGYAIPISTALSLASKIEAGDASSTIVIGYPAFLGVEVAADSSSSGSEGSGSEAGGLPGSLGQGAAGGSGEGSTGGYGDSGSGSGSTEQTVAGAAVVQVIEGTPAESAGIVAGDTITAVNGTSVSSADALSSTLANYKPGQTVTITWVDSTGASHSASVTLTQGPAA